MAPATAAELLLGLAQSLGVRLAARDGKLIWKDPTGSMTPKFLAALAANKPELIALLAAEQGSPPTTPAVEPGQAGDDIPEHIRPLLATCFMWRIPVSGGPDRFIATGPDHDLRDEYPDAVPLFQPGHRPVPLPP